MVGRRSVDNSAENWRRPKKGNSFSRLRCSFQLCTTLHSPIPRETYPLPLGFIFVSFIYSSLAAFHSFWTFDDLIRLSSCYSISVSAQQPGIFPGSHSPFLWFSVSVTAAIVFPHSVSGGRLRPGDNKKVKGATVLYYGKNAIEMHLRKLGRNW